MNAIKIFNLEDFNSYYNESARTLLSILNLTNVL